MSTYNSEIVIPTLKKVIHVLETHHIRYQFLGSIVIAAINGGIHRDLGDLDFIIDSSGKDILLKELKNLGFVQKKGMFTFARRYLALEQLEHPILLSVGYFYGQWKDDGTFTVGNEKTNVSIDSYAVKQTSYELYGIQFIGIPQSAAATGVYTSESNPKRKKEKALLKENNIKPFPNTYIHVRIFSIRADLIYHFTMELLNILGGIRVKLGLPFDPWR